MGQEPTTAILVFANSSEEESRYKPMENGAHIFEALTQRTLKIVQETGLPYFHFSEHQQRGFSFGEKFINAIATVFELGYDNVITLGNDSPHLRTSDLLFALNQLKENNFVLGPSADGGIYLMGLHVSDFIATEFRNLPWQSAHLYKALLDVAASSKKVALLRTLFDLDSSADLLLFISRFKNIGKRLLSIVLSLLLPTMTRYEDRSSFHSFTYNTDFFNKGSPALDSVNFA